MVCGYKVAAVVLGWVSLAVAGEQRQFRGVVYDVPEPVAEVKRGKVGAAKPWYSKMEKDYVEWMSPADYSVRFLVVRGEEKPGDVAVWAGKRIQALLVTMNEEETESDRLALGKVTTKPVKMAGGKTATMVSAPVLRKSGKVKAMWVGIAREEGTRGELAIMEGDPTEDMKRFIGPFMKFCESMKFGAKGLVGEPVKGDLDGVFYGAKSGFVYTLGGGQFQVDHEFWMFSKEGRFYQGLPRGEKLVGFDFRKAFEEEADESGIYRVEGKKIILEYGDGRREEKEFEASAKGVKLGGLSHDKMDVAGEKKLKGTFTSTNYTQFAQGSGVVGGVASSRSYSFREDGRFSMDGFVGTMASFETPGGDRTGGMTTQNKKAGQGKYEVKDGLLTLTANDGTVVRKTIVIATEGLILLDGSAYLDRSEKGKK